MNYQQALKLTDNSHSLPLKKHKKIGFSIDC